MSSANRVRVVSIAETTYGVTPGAGNFQTARFVSESLSATPDTQESQLIRADRQSSGQVVVGLTVGGDVSTELAKDSLLEQYMESAMYDTWNTTAPVAADLDIDVSAKTLDRAAGDFSADGVRVGDILELTGFTDPNNNAEVMVSSVTALQLGIIVQENMTTEVSTGNTFQIADYLEIGTTKKSFSMEKAFLDLTDKAINYTGMIVSTMNLNATYGEIVTATFTFAGNGGSPVDLAADFLTDGRTIDPAATTNPLNGSVDVPFIADDLSGTLADTDDNNVCIQSLEVILNNNLTPETCIGKAAPNDYNEGTGQVTVNINAYNDDGNWEQLNKKITQDPIQIGYLTKNSGGFYGVYMPAVQLSFEDPAAGGANQDVFQNASGQAKIGPNQEKALRIFRG